MNKKSPSILVIGSSNHPRAERCVSWHDTDYSVSDYDLVIANTQSLSVQAISTPTTKEILSLREQFMEAQVGKRIRIICITSKMETRRAESWVDDDEITNYHWCPIIPIFKEQIGKKFGSRDLKSKYQNLVTEYRRVLVDTRNNTGHFTEERKKFRSSQKDLITNQVDQAIAFEVSWWFDNAAYHPSTLFGARLPILFLPEIDDAHAGIELLIAEELGEQQEAAPAWIDTEIFPGEPEIKAKIVSISDEINKLSAERESAEKALVDTTKFKKLLYLKGIPLQDSVSEALQVLGINLSTPNVDNEEDGYFPTDEGKIYFEVRGKDSSGLVMNDVSQMIGRIGAGGNHESDKFTVWGVIVLNHFRKDPPESRKGPFEKNLVDKALPFQIALITSEDLYRLIVAKYNGVRVDDFAEKLFNSIGVFDISRYLEGRVNQ